MTHEIQPNREHKIHRGALVMGAFLVGGLVEACRAVNDKNQPVVSGVKSFHEAEGPSILFFRGCGENYQAQAPLYYRQVQGSGSCHFEYQIQGSHSQELIDQNVIDTCKSDGDRDRIFVCTSMGLMNAMRSLQNTRVQQAVGEDRLTALVSVSGITSKEDLWPNMQQAAKMSTCVPALPVVGDLWRSYRMCRAKGKIAYGPSATVEMTKVHHESSANMRYSLVSSQYRAIHNSEPWQDGSHAAVSAHNPRLTLHQITASHDGVANWKSTNESLERTFDLPVETYIDTRRPHGSHADDLEFIEPLRERLLGLSRQSRGLYRASMLHDAFSLQNNLAYVA